MAFFWRHCKRGKNCEIVLSYEPIVECSFWPFLSFAVSHTFSAHWPLSPDKKEPFFREIVAFFQLKLFKNIIWLNYCITAFGFYFWFYIASKRIWCISMHNLLLSFPVAVFHFQQLNSKNTISFSLANTSFTKQRISLFCTKRNTCKTVLLTLLQRKMSYHYVQLLWNLTREVIPQSIFFCFSSIDRELGSGNRNYKNVTVALKVNGPKNKRLYGQFYVVLLDYVVQSAK